MAKKVLAIRADEDEIARWKVLADGMPLSEWVRLRCNGEQSVPVVDVVRSLGFSGRDLQARSHHPTCNCQMCCK